MTGRVSTFDERRGVGEVQGDDGESYPFHCTRIADGSRSIPRGVAVTFEVAPGGLGRWEAVAISRV
jgi:cold shock CspA family protein